MITHRHLYHHILENFLKPGKIPRRAHYASGINFVLAVSGPAASGKTTFCQGMVDFLAGQEMSAVHVSLDGYLLDRTTRSRRKLSGYDPQSSDLPAMIGDLKTLICDGAPIDTPTYDHKTGHHKKRRRVEPAQVIILDGIMSLQYEMRDRFSNLNIFFTSEDIVIRGLRLWVDMKERGYSLFEALAHSDEEFICYNRWIYPQITFAHLKIWVGKNHELSLVNEPE